MFIFRRVGKGEAETWEILLTEDSQPKLEARFGKALGNGNSDRPRMHEVGVLIAIDRYDEMEILLAVKEGLDEATRKLLDGEVEELLGRDTYTTGRNDEKGWFRWDTLESR